MSELISEEDQERYLDRGLKKIKAQSFHIHTAIEKNNLRQCLKETYSMLSELRTSYLTPKNYYHLFTNAFDEMQNVSNFFQEEIKRGRKVRDLYDSVQQAVYLVPRLYLMITAGALVMENEPSSTREIIFDLLGMVKGIQNPIRGLFVRYYLLKMIKDKLPDKDNIYLKEDGNFEDTLNFLIQNMDEMNGLWIRLGNDSIGNEKILRKREKNELKTLVGESINRLSSLDGLTLELYEKDILPKLIQIILESNDPVSQQYLMECIIVAFPDSYNIKCIELILNTTSRLTAGVDIKGLFINLMEKLARFITDNGGENANDEDKKLVSSAQAVYPILLQYFDRLQKETFMLGEEMDTSKLLDLNTAFMRFSIKCKDTDILGNINHVLTSTLNILRQSAKLNKECMKKLNKLMQVPLESEYSIFDMTDFGGLLTFLDWSSRKNLGLKIIESLYKSNSKEKLDTVEKMQKLLNIIRPLLYPSEEGIEEDPYAVSIEQIELCKMIFSVNSQDPEVIYEIYGELKNVFVEAGPERRKITLPSLANCIISFCHKISLAYDNKNNLVSEEIKKNQYSSENINSVDISKIDSDETFYKLMLNVYKLLNETISLIAEDSPETAYKLYLTSASQVNSIQSDRNNFEEACASFINAAMNIYQEGKYEQNLKYSLLSDLVGYLLSFTILGNENIENTIKILAESGTKMAKRGDQFNSMLTIAQLYYSKIKDGNKTNEYIGKARKYADFAMTNPQNIILFVELLNKFIYFADNGDEVITIKAEQIDELIELITNHIQTVKNEVSMDSSFLPPIESYFNNTLDIIKKRKTEEGHKAIYDSLLNN